MLSHSHAPFSETLSILWDRATDLFGMGRSFKGQMQIASGLVYP